MKRFFLISALIHGILLGLLFSWEIPLANRVLSRNIVEVFLVEKAEEKKEEDKLPESKPAPLKPREKKNLEPAPQVSRAESVEKEENRRPVETVKNPVEPQEERKPIEEKAPPEERILKTKGEEPPMIQTEHKAQVREGDSSEFPPPAANLQVSGKGNSGTTFVASSRGGEIGIGGVRGGGMKGLGPAGEPSPTQLSRIRTSVEEGDAVLFEIMRRIEGAKRYPKAARKMHIEGKTTVRFRIKPDGKVDSVEVVESSGSEILDQASLETVQRAVPLPFKEGWLKVGIVFKIL